VFVHRVLRLRSSRQERALLMLHLLCLAFSPASRLLPVALPVPTSHARAAAPVVALFGTPTKLDFAELDLSRCASYLRTFPTKFRGWGVAEWKLFGLPPLSFSPRPIEGGVALVYYLSETQAKQMGRGGLVEDGGRLEITAAAGGAGFFGPAPRIVIRSKRGSLDRSRHEAVLVARLADECSSSTTSFGTLSSNSWRPPKGTLTKINQLAGACLYEKAVGKRY